MLWFLLTSFFFSFLYSSCLFFLLLLLPPSYSSFFFFFPFLCLIFATLSPLRRPFILPVGFLFSAPWLRSDCSETQKASVNRLINALLPGPEGDLWEKASVKPIVEENLVGSGGFKVVYIMLFNLNHIWDGSQ